jgi:hypothetical protein
MTLSVFISVDMEGIAGITTLRQTFRGTDDYAWGREMMTEEANAAVAGAFDAAARTVVGSVSGAIRTSEQAVATRLVGDLSETSTILALPCSSI